MKYFAFYSIVFFILIGCKGETGTVPVVTPVDDDVPPVVTPVDDDVPVVVNQSITITVGANKMTPLTLDELQSTDADSDDTSLIYTVGNVTNGTLLIYGSAWSLGNNDSFIQQDIADGNVLYSHDGNNDIDSFPYTVEDPSGNRLADQTFNIIKEIQWYRPEIFATWQWQLQGKLNHSYDVDIYDVDLFDVSTEEIAMLKNEGRKVICYFSAGTYEGWRTDWADYFDFITGDSYTGFNPPFAGNMADWDERWLDIRRIDLLSPIMTSRLDLAVTKGCDAVEPDNVDAWSNPDEVNLSPALTANDQLNYNRWLANAAHGRGLSIGLKNDLEQVGELVEHYDFAVNEECFEYDECELLAPFIDNQKPVLNTEYNQKYIDSNEQRDSLCQDSISRKFSTLILPLELDDNYRFSCSYP